MAGGPSAQGSRTADARVPASPDHRPDPAEPAATSEAQRRVVRDHLDAMVSHPEWQGTPRRTALLRHIVSETLAGRGGRLKAASIAMEVFGRLPGGDSQSDAIVRVEARRLRRDLDSFHAGPGRWSPVRIGIPKGGYGAVFEACSSVAPDPDAGRLTATLEHAGDGTPAPVDRPASEARPGDAGPTVVVRPFAALGHDPALRDLADGLWHELIASLLRFPSFRLHCPDDCPAPSAAGGAPSLAAPGPLDSYVVRAALQADSDWLKVSVRLVAATDGRVLWGQTFLRPRTAHDLMRVQSEIARDIASALGDPESGQRDGLIARVARSGAPSMDSYLAVLAAQAHRRTHLIEAHAPTRSALERAVQRDPCYAEAWAHLAFLRLDGHRFGHDPAAGPDPHGPALAAARRALALDPDNITGHLALMVIQHYAGQADGALAAGEQALRLSPHEPDTLAGLGWLRVVGRNEPAGITLLTQAVARAPNPAPRYFRSIAVHHLMWGDPAAALDAALRAAADGSGISQALVAVAEARLGNPAAAAAALTIMAERSARLARDPVAYFMHHRTHPAIIAMLVEGLCRAGLSCGTAPRAG
ncbi:MAG: hypothetical protein ACXIU8_15305 [Alkalilacustris sp.]